MYGFLCCFQHNLRHAAVCMDYRPRRIIFHFEKHNQVEQMPYTGKSRKTHGTIIKLKLNVFIWVTHLQVGISTVPRHILHSTEKFISKSIRCFPFILWIFSVLNGNGIYFCTFIKPVGVMILSFCYLICCESWRGSRYVTLPFIIIS